MLHSIQCEVPETGEWNMGLKIEVLNKLIQVVVSKNKLKLV